MTVAAKTPTKTSLTPSSRTQTRAGRNIHHSALRSQPSQETAFYENSACRNPIRRTFLAPNFFDRVLDSSDYNGQTSDLVGYASGMPVRAQGPPRRSLRFDAMRSPAARHHETSTAPTPMSAADAADSAANTDSAATNDSAIADSATADMADARRRACSCLASRGLPCR